LRFDAAPQESVTANAFRGARLDSPAPCLQALSGLEAHKTDFISLSRAAAGADQGKGKDEDRSHNASVAPLCAEG